MQDSWKIYDRVGSIDARPYVLDEDLSVISVSKEDTPSFGGMIARNPTNWNDQWYINSQYFKVNYKKRGE